MELCCSHHITKNSVIEERTMMRNYEHWHLPVLVFFMDLWTATVAVPVMRPLSNVANRPEPPKECQYDDVEIKITSPALNNHYFKMETILKQTITSGWLNGGSEIGNTVPVRVLLRRTFCWIQSWWNLNVYLTDGRLNGHAAVPTCDSQLTVRFLSLRNPIDPLSTW